MHFHPIGGFDEAAQWVRDLAALGRQS